MPKTILITGAVGGFGRDSALALSRLGHKVIATTHTNAQVQDLKQVVANNNLPIEVFKLDITLAKDRKLIEKYDLDVLINNGAIGESGSLVEIPMGKVRDNFETNVFSTLELTQLALKKMLKNDSGRVIFISSLAGRMVSMPFLASYSMTKFALSAGAEALRQELKRITKNIKVVIIEPGAYATGFNQKNFVKKYDWMDKESYFFDQIQKIKQLEEKRFGMIENKSTKTIVDKIINAVEAKRPKLRYSAPWWQYWGVQLMRMFGK